MSRAVSADRGKLLSIFGPVFLYGPSRTPPFLQGTFVVEIRLTNLTRRFGEVTAVDDVTLTIRPGELFFLLGPSGCGKTTLLRLIAGFLEPDAGTIRFDDRPMERVPAHQRNTGMVFQNYALWPHMTVERNVRYGLDIRRVARDEKHRRVREILALVHMADLADRFPSQLSGGQQQRVALARALVVEPDVVLMDEPLSNLDAKLRLEMRAEIKRIHRRSPRTTVYVTHDQKEALSLADRIALMNDGRIIQVGAPEEVYTRPANLFCARFIAGANTLSGILGAVEGPVGIVRTDLGTFRARLGPEPPAVGKSAAVAVRPELLRPASANDPNVFTAEVLSRMYLGEMVQYLLRAGTTELLATALGSDLWPNAVGEHVLVTFDPGEAVVFPAENLA
jgi:iron(III) transport system ATP-binding protein